MKILSVLIEYKLSSINTPFSYVCEDFLNVKVGCRVYVPFNHQNVVGYVIDVIDTPLSLNELITKNHIQYKYINDLLDDQPILSQELMDLALYMSKEYICPLITCLQTILPPTYKPAKSALKTIKNKKLKKVFVNENVDLKLLKPYQQEIYLKIKNANGIFLKDLPLAKIHTLLKHQFVYYKEEEITEDFLAAYIKANKKNILNDEQQKAVETILTSNKQTFLLQGVTGSGKTEVYLELVESTLKENKTAIVLVPEISLTPMIIKRFKDRFSDIAVLHGSLSFKEKQIQYDKIKNQEVKVVIGARSAIFAPFNNIGLIILDEEQSTSYKQEQMPSYHARDIAIHRANYHHAKVILGSATPSFESKARAMKGVYQIIYLRKRANHQELPLVHIVNMREDMSSFSTLISNTLDSQIKNCLQKNEKMILLQNRRGYAPYVSCRSCGYTFKCPHCELSLSYHKKGDKFKCHYCNFEFKFNHICPKCNDNNFLYMGSGTQKIEEVLQNQYANAKILRMDNDTTQVKNGHLKILNQFEKDDYNILLGTQMVAKGLDFHDVTLVGVIDADISLLSADFRSSEYTFELLSQVAGRAGRGSKQGNVIIQTYNPTNIAITLAAKHQYDLFYKGEMLFRYRVNYPPFSYLSSLTVLCLKADQACLLADKIFNELKKIKDFELLGPASPYVFKENEKYRMKILVKSKNHQLIVEMFNQINQQFALEAKERKCSIQFDIDSYHLL